MKTIVIGFDNISGSGPATVLAGPEVSIREQTLLVTEIKSSRKFPKGLPFVCQCRLEPINTAICTETAAAAKPAVVEKPKHKKSK